METSHYGGGGVGGWGCEDGGDGLGFPEYQKWSVDVLFVRFKQNNILLQVPVNGLHMAPQQKKKEEASPNVKMKMSEEEGPGEEEDKIISRWSHKELNTRQKGPSISLL